jgi:hypothetical protein
VDTSRARKRFERNPYYESRSRWQLPPYIDNFEVNIIGDDANFRAGASRSVAGEINFQVRDIAITDVPLVMEKPKPAITM